MHMHMYMHMYMHMHIYDNILLLLRPTAAQEPATPAERRIGVVDPAGCVPYPALLNSGRLEARSQKGGQRQACGLDAAVYDDHFNL